MADLVDLDADHQRRNQPGHRDVAQLAARQGGVLADWQLIGLGVGRGAINYRLATGRLHSMHRGVYALGHTVVGNRGRLIAAVLACGPGAVVSHRSAADLWGIRPTARKRIDVTVPGRSRARASGDRPAPRARSRSSRHHHRGRDPGDHRRPHAAGSRRGGSATPRGAGDRAGRSAPAVRPNQAGGAAREKSRPPGAKATQRHPHRCRDRAAHSLRAGERRFSSSATTGASRGRS